MPTIDTCEANCGAISIDCELNNLKDIMIGFWKTKVILTSFKLGIFELFEKCAVPLSTESVAQKLDLKSFYGTEAVLNSCVALKLLKRAVDSKTGVPVYSNTDLTCKYLLKDCSPTMYYHFMMLDKHGVMGLSLEAALQTAECQWNKGVNKELDWTEVHDVQSDDWLLQQSKGFYFNSLAAAKFATTVFDLSPFNIICDVGGNHGAILHECARVYPKAHLILFDLPKVIDMAPTFLPTDLEPTKLEMVKGDFFKDVLPKADVYILKNILHNWSQNDERMLAFLTKIYDSLPKGGALLILEQLLNEDKCGPEYTLLFSVMMTCTQEGREMSGYEYKQLMEKAGFNNVQFKHGPITGAVIGFK